MSFAHAHFKKQRTELHCEHGEERMGLPFKLLRGVARRALGR
jgi:hypothetical protein